MKENVSRRDFLKGSAIVAGGAAIAASFAGCAPSAETPKEPEVAAEGASFVERPEQGAGPHPVEFGAARSGADPIPPVAPPSEWSAEADVVVIGTGLGGVSAALYAAQKGLRVIAVEKSAITGGASRHASMILCHHGGTKLQQEKGFAYWSDSFDPDNPEDVKLVAAKELEPYGYSVDSKLFMRQISDGPKWIDWLCEQDGFEIANPETSPRRFRDQYLIDTGSNDIMGFDHMFNALTDDMIAAGVDLRLSTECTSLVADGDTVVGVVAKSGEEELFFKAEKGVILAGGGMGYNLDLLEKYIPLAYMGAANGGPMPSHTGECIRMGLGMGADMKGVGSFSSWMGALDDYWGEGTGEYWSYMWRPINYYAYLPFLSIDKMGNRLPLYIGGASGSYQPLYEGYPFNSGMGQTVAAYMSVGDHRKYMIFDSRHFDHFTDEWATNIYAYYNPQAICYTGLTEEGAKWVPESFQADFDNCVANGSIKKADTLEELEEICGFEKGVLVGAVERWNACVEKGEDDELIVPLQPEWMTYVNTPPYYCARWGGNIGKTLCGLHVNDKMQVISTDFKVIPGLYAAWSTAGGFTGENDISDYGACTPMGSVGASGMSGWVAARAILGEYDA